METISMNSENSKTIEPHKFGLSLLQRLDLRSSNKHVAVQNLSIYYLWKNIREQCNNNKLKIRAPTWSDEFELSDSSHSVFHTQGYVEYIIKRYKTSPTNLPIHIYINRINNRLVFKIKDGYKLELETPETIKLFGSTHKKIIYKTKNGETS